MPINQREVASRIFEESFMSRIFNRKRLAQAIAIALAGCSGASFAGPPATSPYVTDAQNTHVEDATSHGIGTVNMIACILHSLAPDQLVNKNSYVALVDENTCDPNSRDSSSQAGSSASGSQTSYTTTFVNSSRTSNNDPMIVKVWLNETNGGGGSDAPMTIFVHVSATSAPTETNPYGVFRLDFCGHPDDATDSTCIMNGYLDAQAGSLSFYQTENGGDHSSLTALQLTSVGTNSGSGKLSQTKTENGGTATETFAFAYDQNYFLRGDQCFTRDASDVNTGISVWRYGLYDATTGAHIDLNSGFPIQYTSGGTTYQGFLGYWGLSLQ